MMTYYNIIIFILSLSFLVAKSIIIFLMLILYKFNRDGIGIF